MFKSLREIAVPQGSSRRMVTGADGFSRQVLVKTRRRCWSKNGTGRYQNSSKMMALQEPDFYVFETFVGTCESAVLCAKNREKVQTVQHFGETAARKCSTVCTFSRFCADSTALSRISIAKTLYCPLKWAKICIQYSTFARRIFTRCFGESAVLSASFR